MVSKTAISFSNHLPVSCFVDTKTDCALHEPPLFSSDIFASLLRFISPFTGTCKRLAGSLVAETYWQRRLFWSPDFFVDGLQVGFPQKSKLWNSGVKKFRYFFFSQIVTSHLDVSAFDVTVSFLEDVKGEQNLQLWMKNAMVNPEGFFVSCDLGMQENRHCLKQRARDTPKWYIADGSIVSPSKWHDMTVPKGPELGHNIPCLGGEWRRNWYDNSAEKIFSWSCCPCMLARTTWLRAQKEIVGWFATKGIVEYVLEDPKQIKNMSAK